VQDRTRQAEYSNCCQENAFSSSYTKERPGTTRLYMNVRVCKCMQVHARSDAGYIRRPCRGKARRAMTGEWKSPRWAPVIEEQKNRRNTRLNAVRAHRKVDAPIFRGANTFCQVRNNKFAQGTEDMRSYYCASVISLRFLQDSLSSRQVLVSMS